MGYDETHSLEQRLAKIAHDVNNLLGVALGRCELMELRLNTDNPASQEIQQIRERINQAIGLLQQLRRISTPNGG